MAGQLNSRVALVTGGATGIGRAAALAFAEEGAKVVMADVDIKEGEETARLIKDKGSEAVFLRTDVSQTADVEALLNKTVVRFGRLDCAFNNAGIEGESAPWTEYKEEVWERVMDINLKGVWLCMKYELRQMVKQGNGAIVNTSSVMGLVSTPTNPAYSASKHGVLGLTKSAALAYAQAGIRVNAVCPGFVHSPMTERKFSTNPELEERLAAKHPIGRMGTPEEIAAAVVWLCSGAASFVTGHSLTMDGGYVIQ